MIVFVFYALYKIFYFLNIIFRRIQMFEIKINVDKRGGGEK